MTQDQLLISINNLKREIEQNNRILQELESKLDALIDFSNQCNLHVRTFESSMDKRKHRLFSLDNLACTVRSAFRYQAKMSDLLTGSTYQATVASIDELGASISQQKRKINQDIVDQKSYIYSLRARLSELQYEYNHYQEEVRTNE